MSENASGQSIAREHQWCWCRKCQGLFFAGGTSGGVGVDLRPLPRFELRTVGHQIS
jgi:hypothetical protein